MLASLRLALLSFACVALSSPLRAQSETASPAPPERRGPIEAREEWLLIQGHLTLPAISPDPLARGQTRMRLDFDWGSDFGWSQYPKGENPIDRRFLIDGEHRAVALDVRRGITDRLGVGLRLPLDWRGGGILDGVIDRFHRAITHPLGLPDSGRPVFLRNQFRIEGRDAEFHPVVWDGRPGTGLGNLEGSLQWTVHRNSDGWTGAMVGRVSLPSGSGPFRSHGLEGGLQYAAAHRLSLRLDVYLGTGVVFFSDDERDGIQYSSTQIQGFAALEWRVARRFSLHFQTDGSSRLVENLARYPGMQSYLRIGGKLDLSDRLVLEGGFSENLVYQAVTTDFGIFLGLLKRF
jgi:Protein of unknown function (DUF3187)